jgi:hypothetical protein
MLLGMFAIALLEKLMLSFRILQLRQPKSHNENCCSTAIYRKMETDFRKVYIMA